MACNPQVLPAITLLKMVRGGNWLKCARRSVMMKSLLQALSVRALRTVVTMVVLASVMLGSSSSLRAQAPLSLSSNEAWLVIASRPSRNASIDLARKYQARFSSVAVLGSSNGYYAVVLGWADKNRLQQLKVRLVEAGRIPSDSYLSTGRRFVSAVWPDRVSAIFPASSQVAALRLSSDDGGKAVSRQPGTLARVVGLDPSGDNYLSVRTGPGSQFAEVDRLSPNELVSIMGRSGKWFKIVTESNSTGWAFERYIVADAAPAQTKHRRVVTKSDVDRFVRTFSRLPAADIATYRTIYSENVQWYDKGTRTVSEIVEEKARLFAKWPDRNNSIRTIDIAALGSARFLVNYTVRFELANDVRSLCGHWHVELLVAQQPDDTLRIEREDGRDLHQDCTPPRVAGQTASPQTVTAEPAPVAAPATAAKTKVALVIGNGRYSNVPELENPSNDASAMAQVLRDMGFTVVSGVDLERLDMERKIADFARAAASADVSLFFYAGHGIQVAGRNYLVPVEAAVKDQTSLAFELIDVQKVTQFMGGNGKTSIILLDACRDNPLTRSLARSLGASRSASVGQGLAPIRAEHGGMLIGFATAPGNVAADGDGMANSPFTTALLKHLPTPGLEIELAMKKVKAEVLRLTKNKQRPWHNSDLAREIYLVSRK